MLGAVKISEIAAKVTSVKVTFVQASFIYSGDICPSYICSTLSDLLWSSLIPVLWSWVYPINFWILLFPVSEEKMMMLGVMRQWKKSVRRLVEKAWEKQSMWWKICSNKLWFTIDLRKSLRKSKIEKQERLWSNKLGRYADLQRDRTTLLIKFSFDHFIIHLFIIH